MPNPAKKPSNVIAALHVRAVSPELKILKAIAEESKSNRTDKVSSSQIDRVTKAARVKK